MKQTKIKDLKGQERTNEQQSVVSFDNAVISKKSRNKTEPLRKLKSTKSLIFAIAIGSVAFMSSCNSPSERGSNTREDSTHANADQSNTDQDNAGRNNAQDNAQRGYEEEVDLFRIETEGRIVNNENHISDINFKINRGTGENKAEYESQIADLEQRNNGMRRRMDEYRGDSQKDWESFKTEFNRDMDKLGNDLKGFVTDSN